MSGLCRGPEALLSNSTAILRTDDLPYEEIDCETKCKLYITVIALKLSIMEQFPRALLIQHSIRPSLVRGSVSKSRLPASLIGAIFLIQVSVPKAYF